MFFEIASVSGLAPLARDSDSPNSECLHLLRRTLCALDRAGAQGKREVCRTERPRENLGGVVLWQQLQHFHLSLAFFLWGTWGQSLRASLALPGG